MIADRDKPYVLQSEKRTTLCLLFKISADFLVQFNYNNTKLLISCCQNHVTFPSNSL